MSVPGGVVPERLRANLAAVRERISAACLRTGRNPHEVRIEAVTKSVPLSVIQELIGIGQSDLGENRPQQLITRAIALAEIGTQSAVGSPLPEASRPSDGGTSNSTGDPSTHSLQPSIFHWHLIGQLQRNKVRAVLPCTAMIHSVDSLKLLQRVGQIAEELGLRPRVLLQANVSGEQSKSGFETEALRHEWPELVKVKNVELQGLMTMAPETEDVEIIRSTFRNLRLLRDELQLRSPEPRLRELSMGMSSDFEIAVEEGATMVRLGSVLFEGLTVKG